jgi:signal transduction histidine kinase/ActR/RegA family two-component response regulator
MTALLSKEHTILEKGPMEFRPFGIDEHGQKIRDISGVIVKASVEYLEESVAGGRRDGTPAAAVQRLCALLNERIKDPAYHVSPGFLKNVWHSYSYEFVCFLREFCIVLSGDPHFPAHAAKEKHTMSPLIQILGRPFSLSEIYRMWAHFGQKYAKGSLEFTVGAVTERSAVLRMKFTDRVYRQFGQYRKRCAAMACESAKSGLAMVSAKIHHLPPATFRDIACVANGDDWCEWEFTWAPQRVRRWRWSVVGVAAAAASFAYLRIVHPEVSAREAVMAAAVPGLGAWLAARVSLSREVRHLRELIREQDRAVDVQHEELREAYLEQEHTTVELRQRVNQLTTLHRSGLSFSSTLDRETLLHYVLDTIVHDLHYDRAMISFYDPERRISYDARVRGVHPEVAEFARGCEVPITDPESLEGMVVLQGKPVLIGDLETIWDRLHPLNQQLASLTGSKAVLAVPMKVKERVLGTLMAERLQQHTLTQDDLDLLVTVANQVAIALDNTEAYRQIEELNVGLEAKVRERTAELERADRLRSMFLSHVSHELRTPLTSIKGFVDNLLGGIGGALADKQQIYLGRIKVNADRLIRMISDLLDQSRIEAGKLELLPAELDLYKTVADVLEQLRPLALTKRQRLDLEAKDADLIVWADADRLTQIVTNLVQNAIKFTPDEGIVKVEIIRQGHHLAKVSVTDTGPGIPAEGLDKIFDPFFRISQGTRPRTQGIGLGLSIVKTLVELHGGSVTVHSEAGHGAEFSFTMPLHLGTPIVREAAAAARRVLVVDDDPDIRQIVSDCLKTCGYAVDLAADGQTALTLLGPGGFDGVVLDVGLTDIDGEEVLRRLRAKPNSVPVIMVTASGSQQRAVRAVSLGAQAYLLKPFDLGELRQIAVHWFGRDASRTSA